MTITLHDRALPHDLAAERAVLGAILIRPDTIFDVAEHVSPVDFFRDGHRRVFHHMLVMRDRHVTVDALTLRDALEAAGDLDAAGGPAYLFALTDGVPHSTNAVDYARIVREKAVIRDIAFVGQKIVAQAYEASGNASDILDSAQAALFGVADRQASGAFVDMATLMGDTLNEVEKLVAEKRHITGVPTGFTELDGYTRGFQRQDLIVIAARPSMGKTSFAMNIAENAAIGHGLRVGVFSLEMGRKALGLRLLASQARVNHHKLLSGYIYDADYARMSIAMERLTAAGLFVDDSSGANVFDIRAKARRLKADKGLDLIVIDYLQLMNAAQKAENKNLEVAANTKALKAIAKDLDVPVVLLSQLSRDVEKRGTHKPQMSDLRDSGAIEQDADVILFLFREEKYDPRPDNVGVAEVIIGKQRNGPTGTIKLTFSDHLVRFDNLSHDRGLKQSYAEPQS